MVVNSLFSSKPKPKSELETEFDFERDNPYIDHDTPPNPYNPLNWLRLIPAYYIHVAEWWRYRKPLPWEKVDMYPPVAAYRPKRRPRLLRFLLFFLIFILPMAIYFWGHRWGIILPHPIVFLASNLPPLAELPSWTVPVSVPFCEWNLGPLRHVQRIPRLREDFQWLWHLLFYGDTVRCWLSALVHSRLHFYWYVLTPAHFTQLFYLTLTFLVLEELFQTQIPQKLWEQLFYWPRIRDVPEILPDTPGPPVRWFLYNLRFSLRNFTLEEQQWEAYFEAPEDAWTPEQWRRWKIIMTALGYPAYILLLVGWCCIRMPLVFLALLVYPVRLIWLLDRHYTKILPTLGWLLHSIYLGLLALTLRPLNPLAGYFYPPLAARWERFDLYYWRYWWDQNIYEPIYEFIIKAELRMDFLDGEWLPQEETEDGWWLRMVRDRRYHFRLYRRLLGWYFWFPFRPLVLPFTMVIMAVNAVFIRPVFTFPLVVVGSYLFKTYHRWRQSGSTIPFFLEDPLNYPRIQSLWLPTFLAVEDFLRSSWAWIRGWIWNYLLPLWFREVRPRFRFLRQVVLPWLPLPLALAYFCSPVSLWLSDWFPYKPHVSEMFLAMAVGFLLLGLFPPLQRWAYWDLNWLLPLLMSAATLDQTMYWIPRVWTPYLWGLEFPTWLLTYPIPWLLAPFKPLLVFPFMVPLTLATVLFPILTDFFGTFPVLGEALFRLLGSWFYLIWGWWLELIWQWLLWPVLAKPFYHIELWYYYALKPLLFLLLRWLDWFMWVISWLVAQSVYWYLWCYWMLPDILLTSANTFLPPWVYHILYDGWCPFPLLQDPRPPSTTPYWDPRWAKPRFLTDPKLFPPFPWPPPPPFLGELLYRCWPYPGIWGAVFGMMPVRYWLM